MPTLRSATTRPARNTSTTSSAAITVDAAATSSVTLTQTTRCHWTRARITTLVACSAARVPTATATSKYGAVGTAATPPAPANVPRREARPCRRARFLRALRREARPHRAKPRPRWQSACRVTGTGAPSKPPIPAGSLRRFTTRRTISGLATYSTPPRFTIPAAGRLGPQPRRTYPLVQHEPLRSGVA